ncbi:MAG: CBS and ACT domain-containing protein [Treponema sp.]|nr:CBS and ACT domain-containing protein [Treponema sp.]
MLVGRVMTKNPVFVNPEMSINEVRSLMDKEKVGHLPVLDKNNVLCGIVTREDLYKASPSAATSLDMYEISYLLSKMTVKDVMVKNVITVEGSEVVEEAARIMADRGIGCLPVMRGKLLVGIITDTDLFRVFINAFGARHPGLRFTCNIQEKPGEIAKLTQKIAEQGGNIIAFITFDGDDLSCRRVTAKVEGLSKEAVEAIVREHPGIELEDIR